MADPIGQSSRQVTAYSKPPSPDAATLKRVQDFQNVLAWNKAAAGAAPEPNALAAFAPLQLGPVGTTNYHSTVGGGAGVDTAPFDQARQHVTDTSLAAGNEINAANSDAQRHYLELQAQSDAFHKQLATQLQQGVADRLAAYRAALSGVNNDADLARFGNQGLRQQENIAEAGFRDAGSRAQQYSDMLGARQRDNLQALSAGSIQMGNAAQSQRLANEFKAMTGIDSSQATAVQTMARAMSAARSGGGGGGGGRGGRGGGRGGSSGGGTKGLTFPEAEFFANTGSNRPWDALNLEAAQIANKATNPRAQQFLQNYEQKLAGGMSSQDALANWQHVLDTTHGGRDLGFNPQDVQGYLDAVERNRVGRANEQADNMRATAKKQDVARLLGLIS